jgi:hypothetical protein
MPSSKKFYLCDETMDEAMVAACGLYGGKKEIYKGFGVRKSEEKRQNWRPNLRWDGRTWSRFPWLRKGQEVGSYKNGNESTNSMKCVELFYLPRTTHLEFDRWPYVKERQQFSDGDKGNCK